MSRYVSSMGAMSIPGFDPSVFSTVASNPIVRQIAKQAGVPLPPEKTATKTAVRRKRPTRKSIEAKMKMTAPSADPSSVAVDPLYETEVTYEEEEPSGLSTPMIIGGIAAAGILLMIVMKKKKK